MAEARHVPVLVERTLDLLAPAMEVAGPVLVDATIGLGGHAHAALQRFPDARVIGIDRDAAALRRCRERLAGYQERTTLVDAVFDNLGEVLSRHRVPCAHAVLFDLGVSSMQLDTVDRGFSYARDAPLDMRMGAGELTAAMVVNTYPATDLVRLLREYGEERFASRIADRIVAARTQRPLRTSAELVDVVRQAIPAPARRRGGNPAKRTFQALRIEVNDELNVLRRALPAALDALCVGGRMVVLAYHSLEDRIVKRVFAAATTTTAPEDLPVVPEHMEPAYVLLTRGAEVASEEEADRNRRAQSVRLRAVQRTGGER